MSSVAIDGTEQLSAQAIKPCLLTLERARFGLTLGFASSDCQAPPFDSRPPRLSLWAWPWSDWHGLNLAIVDADVARIERFYRARGFYDAKVVDVRFEPEAAGVSVGQGPSVDSDAEGQGPSVDSRANACQPDEEACHVDVTFVVEEGTPIRVGQVRVEGIDAVAAQHRSTVRGAALPSRGQRFDELDYDRGKQALRERLGEAGYAAALVEGQVYLDHGRKQADIRYHVDPGAVYRFGKIRVEGQAELPSEPIVAVARPLVGRPYRHSALVELQQDVYALGAFAAVEISHEPSAQRREVDLLISVRPLPPREIRLGIGVTAGTLQRTDTAAVHSVPQWDLHFFARYEQRHVLGLGKLRIEERPRLVQQEQFPGFEDPQLGNLVRLRLTEPGWFEPRVLTTIETKWDYGPDPFQGFLRSDIFVRFGLQRAFLRRTLFAGLALQYDRYILHEDRQGSALRDLARFAPRDYDYTFLEQDLRLDLRDNDLRPRAGALLIWRASASLESPISDWSLLRIEPDARAYVPLPFGASLAFRFAAAAVFVFGSTDADPVGRTLGPYAYRLRGGGAQGNRGYLAGELGIGPVGGIRRWETSAELRLRLGENWGAVGFYDMGNVTAGDAFGFRDTNPSAGFGLRYLTLVGTIRVDLGFRLDPQPSRRQGDVSALLARLPSAAGEAPTYSRDPLSTQWIFGAAGALHVTIGEAF